MHERYRMYKRKSGVFYAKDRKTGQRLSLATNDLAEAKRLLTAKNQATEQPCLNVAMARVYLSAQSPEFVSRNWGHLVELVAQGYEGATAVRWRKFAISAPLKLLVELPIYQTEATHLMAVMAHKKAGVSTNVWLRILHNRALDLGWLLAPALHKKLWTKVKYKDRRAIKANEHAQVLLSEKMDDYRKFFRLLWETGGSQTDIANLRAENINWSNNRLFYSRKKLANRGGGMASLAIGAGLKVVLDELPSTGPLFPRLFRASVIALSVDDVNFRNTGITLPPSVSLPSLSSKSYGLNVGTVSISIRREEPSASILHCAPLALIHENVPPV